MSSGDTTPRTATSAEAVPGSPVSIGVPHERMGVRLARHAFADQITAAGVEGEARDDAMLVLSELVSNAVKHAAPLPSGEISVRWQLDDEVLHIEITDGGASTRPRAGIAALSALGGRGLDIVRSVSRHWGVTEGEGSVTVWAEVPRRSDRPGEPATC
jgi:anti-sigma regulatory factor (Ser/Thr protein kinase)